MDKKKIGAVLLVLALVLSIVALTLYFNTEEDNLIDQETDAPVGGNSADIRLTVEPNTGEANGSG